MYTKFWNLTERPFEERADARWFYGSSVHQTVLDNLRTHVEQNRDPLTLLCGGIGSGKSLLVDVFASSLPATFRTIRLQVAPRSSSELIGTIGRELLQLAAGDFLPDIRRPLGELSEQVIGDDQHVVVLVDGANYLEETELHRFLELAAQLTAGKLSVILVGLTHMLAGLRRLKLPQPSVGQLLLGSLNPRDTFDYITHRIRYAGGDPTLFSPTAVEVIYDLSSGVPRRINRICDLSLLIAYSEDNRTISAEHLWKAQGEVTTLHSTRTAASSRRRQLRSIGTRFPS